MANLVIGYGNPLRGDDGVGWAVIERLKQTPLAEPLMLIASHQLLPELTDLIRDAAQVTFVDATVLGEPGTIRITSITPDLTGPASSHQMGPGVLLAYTQELYGCCPPAHLITITGAQFGYEETLSPLIQAKLEAICQDVLRGACGVNQKTPHAPRTTHHAPRTMTKITVVEEIMSANDRLAEQNQACLDQHGVLGLNIMAAPGSGKTSIILRTIGAVAPRLRLGVVEGDTAPVTIDADKIAAAGRPAVQINTGGSCHLDAVMLAGALPQLNLDELDLLIVENVGNLICTASFNLGTHLNVVIASVPEGDDKPYKYPGIYRHIDALILNKMDLMPYIDFDMAYFRQGIELLNPGVTFFPISCKTGEGINEWATWLLEQIS